MMKSVEKGKESTNPSTPLQIKKVLGKTMTRIPKGAFKKASHNPNVRITQNYSIVEDLAQTPCAMSTLELLQSFPSQRKSMVSTLGVAKTSNLGAILFNPTILKPHIPHHVAFQIVVAYTKKYFTGNIFHTVVDEGASTCMMLLACWKAIGYLELSLSSTLLTDFDSWSFRPHRIIPSFPV
jgi:hypothetical protein